MNHSFTSSFFLSITVLLTTNSAFADGSLTFAKSVDAVQAKTLGDDLDQDWSLPDNPQMRAMFGLSDLSSASIRNFITDRVRYVVGEDEDLKSNLGILQRNYVYQNPALPDFETPAVLPPEPPSAPDKPQAPPTQGKIMVVMSNIGSSFYMLGKANKALLGFRFISESGTQILPIATPYHGFLRIGEGLFAIQANRDNPAAEANSVFRMATLFHESRHSDGNGKTLGFSHAVCPKGSDYYNYNACDRNSNGPYTAGAMFMQQARLKCMRNGKCNAADAESLAIMATDSYSRIIDQRTYDAKPEGI